MNPKGVPLWLSQVLPSGVRDIDAARQSVLAAAQPTFGTCRSWPTGYQGAGHGVFTPVKKPKGGQLRDRSGI